MNARTTLQNWASKSGLLIAALALTGMACAQSFTLVGPPSATVLPVEGKGSNTATPSWNADNSLMQPTYSWVLLDGNGTHLVSLPSNNGGSATDITLDFAMVDGLLASLGVTQGASVMAQWLVESTDGMTTNLSDTFDITLERGVVL